VTAVYFSNRHTMRILTGFSFESPKTMEEFVDFYAELLARGSRSRRREAPMKASWPKSFASEQELDEFLSRPAAR